MGKDTKNGITHYGKGHTKRYHTPWERTYKTASHTMGKDIQTASLSMVKDVQMESQPMTNSV